MGVVNQEATTLTALENERMRGPSWENLVRDHENGTRAEDLQVLVTRLHSVDRSSSLSLSLYEPVPLASKAAGSRFLRSSDP